MTQTLPEFSIYVLHKFPVRPGFRIRFPYRCVRFFIIRNNNKTVLFKLVMKSLQMGRSLLINQLISLSNFILLIWIILIVKSLTGCRSMRGQSKWNRNRFKLNLSFLFLFFFHSDSVKQFISITVWVIAFGNRSKILSTSLENIFRVIQMFILHHCIENLHALRT